MNNQADQVGWGKVALRFIQLTRPLFLLGVAVVYALGAGVARYLGVDINWNAYLLGQAWVTLLQLSAQYFNEYYNAPADQVNPNRTWLTGGSGALGPGKLPRNVAFIAALVCLAFLSSLTVVVISQLHPPPEVFLIMGLAFLGSLFYSNPPINLESLRLWGAGNFCAGWLYGAGLCVYPAIW